MSSGRFSHLLRGVWMLWLWQEQQNSSVLAIRARYGDERPGGDIYPVITPSSLPLIPPPRPSRAPSVVDV
ncbi:hypothetical protein EYF80_053123 [Liparis tanakae]|uniref:Uncharacterized protein n=1 Tax=Liparis tanakae TaxID=230148 RepID=A0A4Z2F742_9TELE|nr:hypothetical protein EYF80_053123 [Liparis tanakae]